MLPFILDELKFASWLKLSMPPIDAAALLPPLMMPLMLRGARY